MVLFLIIMPMFTERKIHFLALVNIHRVIIYIMVPEELGVQVRMEQIQMLLVLTGLGMAKIQLVFQVLLMDQHQETGMQMLL